MADRDEDEGPVPPIWEFIASHLRGIARVLTAAAVLVGAGWALYLAIEQHMGPCDAPHEKQPLYCSAAKP